MDTTTRMPALYIGHGAPPLLDDPVWSGQLRALAGDIPRPQAILIVSAHWESAPLSLSASGPGIPLVYDFGGFPERYYRMTYETPDATALAQRIAAMMPATEPVHQHASRGLDHGAWVPLKIMYPEADIPVLQMSLPTQDPYKLLALGSRLQELRDEGVLIIGSGFLTHGLPFLTEFRIEAKAPGWSVDFDRWAAEALARGDVAELAAYRTKAPGMPYAHPTVEHYIPLFVTLGAATEAETPADQVIDGYWMGLSKRSLLVA
ncbi:MAG: Extradiol ring-cleavage dioxygenase, class enzyme subunit [Marmoricola sp.]|jgi:4,5-DOPA dioxygenase extradiol|nr:Extradiol ring-cleavage dioxygenase, class enzyme subunit [Marmoricola sp.]MCW2838495.1 Extradiol ring-cleavage dioxygenase, class enzyme subunit [Marmoricola sp.]